MEQNPKSQNVERQNLLFQVLKDAAAPSALRINKTTEYAQRDNKLTERATWAPTRKLKPTEEAFNNLFKDELKKKIKESSSEALKQLEEFAFQIGIDVGDEMVEVSGLEKLTFKEDNAVEAVDAQYVPEKGVVTLIDFWATWCGPCQGPMSHNEELLKKNEEAWKGKAKVVAISFDDEQEPLVDRVNDKGWKRVEHFRMKNGWDDENKALELFSIQGIPFVVLIDSESKIVFKGHPSQINLEEKINQLISGPAQSEGAVQASEETSQVTKENFKILKKFLRTDWKNFLTENNITSFNESFNLTLSKEIQIDVEGQKVKRNYKKLRVSYKIKENKELAQKGVDLIKTLPEGLVDFELAIFSDPAQEYKNHIAFLRGVATEYGLDLKIQELEKVKFDLDGGVKQTSSVSQLGSFGPDKAANAKEIAAKLQKYFKENQQTNVAPFHEFVRSAFNFSVDVGQPYQSISNVHKKGVEDVTTLDHQPGQVLVIDFWAFWCGPCIAGLKKNTTLIEKNKANWEGKVRFVALSLEDAKSTKVLDDESTKSWQEAFEFYFFKDGRANPAPNNYKVQFIPHYVLVGKDGLVKVLGAQSDIEAKVNELINEEAQASAQPAAPAEAQITQEQIANLIAFLGDKQQLAEFQEERSKLPKGTLQFSIQTTTSYLLEDNGKTLNKVEKPVITFWVREVDRAVVDKFLQKVYQIIPESGFQVKGTYEKTVDIPIGEACSLCQKALNDQTQQYYSPFTKVHYCVECAEADDTTQKGLNRYKVKDTVVFINAPLSDPSVLKGVQESKFGKNLKIGENEEGSQQHPMSCNGRCQKQKVGPRYISISTRVGPVQGDGFVDFCQGCFEIIKTRDSEAALKIQKENEDEKLKLDTLFVRILFNHGYYDY